MSSVGSVDSHASAFSGMTRWSTITGSGSVSSEPNSFEGLGLGRLPNLSIDPKLFQMKEKSPEDVDEMTTAVPPIVKTPTRKTKAQSTADRKKISHARKVCPICKTSVLRLIN